MTVVLTFVCTRCHAGWTAASAVRGGRCGRCGSRDWVLLRGSYLAVDLRPGVVG